MTLQFLLLLTFATLIAATIAGQALRAVVHSDGGRATLSNANLRIGAWWVLCGMMGLALTLGNTFTIAIFAVLSCVAVLEFAGIAGEQAPKYALCILTVIQYALVWSGSQQLFSLMIPVGGLVYLLFRRTPRATLWGLLACTYGVSHAPALLMLNIRGYEGRNATLLFYYLLVVQSSDVFQYCWGKALGRHRIAPGISPNKTWEGFLGGVLTSVAIGTALYKATPFQPAQAACLCAAITLMGFAGGLAMSAFKRKHGAKDFGKLVIGHGGVLDRLDSICFSAPVFFYLTKLM